MFLRMLAKARVRLRRRFFRLPPFVRWFLVGGIVACLLLIAQVSCGFLFARQFPYLYTSANLYAQWTPSVELTNHADAFASGLSVMTNIKQEEMKQLLTSLHSFEAESYIMTDMSGVVFVAKQPTTLPTDVPQGWNVHYEEVGSVRYAVLYQQQWPERSTFIWTWWRPLRLHALQQQYQSVMVVNMVQNSVSMPVYAGLLANPDHWTVVVSPKTASLRNSGIKQADVSANHAFFQSTKPLAPLFRASLLADWFSQAHPVWQTILESPFELTVTQGTWFELINPFYDAIRWVAITRGNASQANGQLQTILSALMKQFPLASERVLPDKSKVFELRRSEDFFISPNQNLNVEEAPTGVFTFPHDQIAYAYRDGELVLAKGAEGEQPASSIVNPCSFDRQIAQGHLSSALMGINMWTNVFFGLDKAKFVGCIVW